MEKIIEIIIEIITLPIKAWRTGSEMFIGLIEQNETFKIIFCTIGCGLCLLGIVYGIIKKMKESDKNERNN